MHVGISSCNSRPCTIRAGLHLTCILRILLYCMAKCHHRSWSEWSERCTFVLPWVLQNYHHLWHLNRFFVTKTAFSYPLFHTYSAFWSTEWTLLVNHWVQTYLGSQGALVPVQSKSCTWSDTCYQPRTWSISSCPHWLCKIGHAWWDVSKQLISTSYVLYLSLQLLLIIRYWPTTTTTSGPGGKREMEANNSDHIQQSRTQDDDPYDEIVNGDVIAKVTLPYSVCESYLFDLVMPSGRIYFLGRQWTLQVAARMLEQPGFPVLVRRFLFDQLNPNPPVPSSEIMEDMYPVIEDKIYVFSSAVATFHAPSDISGVTGMHCKYIQATSSWRRGPGCYDYILVNTNMSGRRGFDVAWVFLFFLFSHQGVEYPCALIQWYSFIGNEPDKNTGCWMVKPDVHPNASANLTVIHMDCIIYAAHLMPIIRTPQFVDCSITMYLSLNRFQLFYISRFVNHHAFEFL